MSYFLTSQRLGFSIWNENSLDLALGLWGDEEVTALIGGPFSEEYIRNRLQTEIDNQRQFHIQYWPIHLLPTGELVGCCGFRPYHAEPNMLEMGFHLKSQFWGKGFGYEAGLTVIQFAFDSSGLGVDGLFAGHHPHNVASKSLIEKLGFQFSHSEFYYQTGLDHPSYFLRKADFKRDR